jgi:DNA/RNA endonuclease YhcR with UshA esterase domain
VSACIAHARVSQENTAQIEETMVMGMWVEVEGEVEKLQGSTDVKVLECEQIVLAAKRCIGSHSPRW